ncbi:hypothetical protein MPSEU_000117000 [Mayamaea pseudoterrestris]|nr:hypothetical protein MPSEU_000117000 [Mayamaea pseudoterrestris]
MPPTMLPAPATDNDGVDVESKESNDDKSKESNDDKFKESNDDHLLQDDFEEEEEDDDEEEEFVDDNDDDDDYEPAPKKRKAPKAPSKASAKKPKKRASVKAKKTATKKTKVAGGSKKKPRKTGGGKSMCGNPQECMLVGLVKMETYGIKSASLDHVALFANYTNKDSLGSKKAIKALTQDGMVDVSDGMMRLTECGRNSVTTVPPVVNQAEALERLQEIVKLFCGSKANKSDFILEQLGNGQKYAKKALGSICGYANVDSLGFKSVLAILKELGLLEDTEAIMLNDKAFPCGRPSGSASAEK